MSNPSCENLKFLLLVDMSQSLENPRPRLTMLEDGLNLLVRPSSGGGGGLSGTFSYLFTLRLRLLLLKLLPSTLSSCC